MVPPAPGFHEHTPAAEALAICLSKSPGLLTQAGTLPILPKYRPLRCRTVCQQAIQVLVCLLRHAWPLLTAVVCCLYRPCHPQPLMW